MVQGRILGGWQCAGSGLGPRWGRSAGPWVLVGFATVCSFPDREVSVEPGQLDPGGPRAGTAVLVLAVARNPLLAPAPEGAGVGGGVWCVLRAQPGNGRYPAGCKGERRGSNDPWAVRECPRLGALSWGFSLPGSGRKEANRVGAVRMLGEGGGRGKGGRGGGAASPGRQGSLPSRR